jgi:hypothetical protein
MCRTIPDLRVERQLKVQIFDRGRLPAALFRVFCSFAGRTRRFSNGNPPRAGGAKVIDQLARDLRAEFPDMRRLSPRNMKYMRAFAEAWPEEGFVQQAAAQITWFHNCILLDQVKDG